MSHSHPDPALLVAYLDGTLFHRDTAAVDAHLETCTDCAALLASMREKREAEQAASASRKRMIVAAAVASVVLVGIGVWSLRPRPPAEPPHEPEAASPIQPGAAAPSPSAPPSTSPLAGEFGNASSPSVAATPSAPSPAAPAATAPAARTPPKQETPARQAAESPAPRPEPAPRTRAEARRQRQEEAAARAPRVMWRTRDQSVESSTDGGATWTTDHTADRPIRAGAFVNENVAWVVGDNGLVLRRTANGWFGSSPPAEGNITAVTATSPSRATVTLEDGRVFTTGNGGVTWMSVEPGSPTGTESTQKPRRSRRRTRRR